jgi:hypothetical protein
MLVKPQTKCVFIAVPEARLTSSDHKSITMNSHDSDQQVSSCVCMGLSRINGTVILQGGLGLANLIWFVNSRRPYTVYK